MVVWLDHFHQEFEAAKAVKAQETGIFIEDVLNVVRK